MAVNDRLYREAKKYIPGGVNSPVRSFKAVGGTPIFIDHAKGSKLYAKDKTKLIDYCLSWGALILGHTHPDIVKEIKKAAARGTSFGTATELEIEFAKLIVEAVPSIDKVRLTSSGTEAVMSAVRLARASTGKNKIIKFEGAYHGHADYLLAKAGSGAATLGIPNSLGVPLDSTKHTILAPYNNLEALQKVMEKYKDDLAAIIVEPVMANMGVIPPKEGFLKSLRNLADRYKALLIFDEVITGFRLSYGGAQEFFGVKPDLTCLGKIVGGGMPIGAFGGKKKIMDLLAPLGGVYQAGTLSGNPVAVSAGIAQLKILKKIKPYERLAEKTRILCEGIKEKAAKLSVALECNYISSIFSVSFKDVNLFKRFFWGLVKNGIYFSPSPFEANFLATSHTDSDIEKTLKAVDEIFKLGI